MLAACAAKRVQCIARDIVSARNGDFLDGFGHVCNRNPYEAVGDFFGGASIANVFGELIKSHFYDKIVEWFVLFASKNGREVIGMQFP